MKVVVGYTKYVEEAIEVPKEFEYGGIEDADGDFSDKFCNWMFGQTRTEDWEIVKYIK